MSLCKYTTFFDLEWNSISAKKIYSTLRYNTYITLFYCSLYLSEKFIPNTNFDVRSQKKNGTVCEQEELIIEGSLMSTYPDL